MIAETRSLSRPDPRVELAALAAIAVFAGAWALLHVGFYTRHQILDTPVYQRYGNAISRGQVPYRDFAVEYPPGALPMFALPGLADPGHDQDVTPGFRHTFETLLWFCGATALLAMAVVLHATGAGRAHVWARSSSAGSTSGPRCSSSQRWLRSPPAGCGLAAACSGLRSP